MFVKRMFCVLALGALLVATAVPASAEMLDEVADLDLTNVVKAVHWGNDGSGIGWITTDQTIGDTTFLLSGGFNVTANGVTTAGMGYCFENEGWTGVRPDIGATPDDEALENILDSTINSAAEAATTITIPMPNGFYKLQLLFYDQWVNARSMDVVVEGVTIATQYDQTADQGGTDAAGSLLAHEFTLTDDQVDILFTNITAGMQLSGLIITIPEPSTFVLAVFGLLGLAFYGLRRRNR